MLHSLTACRHYILDIVTRGEVGRVRSVFEYLKLSIHVRAVPFNLHSSPRQFSFHDHLP